MKVAKWLMVAACALVFCACSKNPLAYVEEDANNIQYLNTGADLDENEWKAFERFKFDNEIRMTALNQFTFFGTDLKEHKAKVAYWEKLEEKDDRIRTKEDSGRAVIVFEDFPADKFIYNAVKNADAETEETEIDGYTAFLFKRDKKIQLTMIKINDKTVQIFFSTDKPGRALEASNNSELAGKINKDAVFASAIASDIIQKQMKKREDAFKEESRYIKFEDEKQEKNMKDMNKKLDVGDYIKTIYLDGGKLLNETVIEADELAD